MRGLASLSGYEALLCQTSGQALASALPKSTQAEPQKQGGSPGELRAMLVNQSREGSRDVVQLVGYLPSVQEAWV